jgi:hypothetical protein
MKELVMFKTDKDDYQKFIINFGIVPALILLEKFEKLELYEECCKILGAIKSINKKGLIYKETKLTDQLINEVVDDYRKMGIDDMDKEKLMERSERYASSFISNNSFLIFKSR